MKLTLKIIALLAVSIASSGCTEQEQEPKVSADPQPTTKPAPKPVAEIHPTVKTTMQAMGGFENWLRVAQVDATVTISVWDKNGRKYINNHKITVDFLSGNLTSDVKTGAGAWRAVVSMTDGDITGRGFTARKDVKELMIQCLSRLLHRIHGPLNLAIGAEKTSPPTKVDVEGETFLHLEVTSDNSLASAYYIDPSSHLIKYVTAGSDKPGKAPGTVSIFTYLILPNGMLFPKEIKVMSLGDHVLVGTTPLFEAEFIDVTVYELVSEKSDKKKIIKPVATTVKPAPKTPAPKK